MFVNEVLNPTNMTEENLLTEEKWMNTRTGDIIKIKQDESVTADVLILSTSDPHHLAYRGYFQSGTLPLTSKMGRFVLIKRCFCFRYACSRNFLFFSEEFRSVPLWK